MLPAIQRIGFFLIVTQVYVSIHLTYRQHSCLLMPWLIIYFRPCHSINFFPLLATFVLIVSDIVSAAKWNRFCFSIEIYGNTDWLLDMNYSWSSWTQSNSIMCRCKLAESNCKELDEYPATTTQSFFSVLRVNDFPGTY